MIKSGLNSLPRPKYASISGTAGPTSLLLLHFDGTNGGTTFTDVHGHTFSVVSSPPTTSTVQQKFGTASLLPAGGVIGCPTTSAFVCAADFTADMWIYLPNLTSTYGLWGFSASTFSMNVNASGKLQAYDGTTRTAGSAISSANAWHHMAWTRAGTSNQLFVDGISVLTWSNGTSHGAASQTFQIAQDQNFGYTMGSGSYIDEFRFIVGTAAWTSNFTPPSSAYIQ